jgi:hypothetical protein
MIVWSNMSRCSGVGRGRECNPRKDAWHGDRGEQLRISLRNVHSPTAKPVGGHAPDYQELLREFVEDGGSFVLVGGVGGCDPRPPRTTDDVDLFVEANEEDSVRVFDALDRFGPPRALHGVTAGLCEGAIERPREAAAEVRGEVGRAVGGDGASGCGRCTGTLPRSDTRPTTRFFAILPPHPGAAMAFEQLKRDAQRILEGLEDAKLNTDQTYHLVVEADPTLVFFLFAWLRANYPSTHSASDGVLGRLGELVTKYPTVARMARAGESDAVVAWFQDAYGYRDFRSREFIDLVVDKLES